MWGLGCRPEQEPKNEMIAEPDERNFTIWEDEAPGHIWTKVCTGGDIIMRNVITLSIGLYKRGRTQTHSFKPTQILVTIG